MVLEPVMKQDQVYGKDREQAEVAALRVEATRLRRERRGLGRRRGVGMYGGSRGEAAEDGICNSR